MLFYTGKSDDRYVASSILKENPDYENQKDVETYENTVVMDPEEVYEASLISLILSYTGVN